MNPLKIVGFSLSSEVLLVVFVDRSMFVGRWLDERHEFYSGQMNAVRETSVEPVTPVGCRLSAVDCRLLLPYFTTTFRFLEIFPSNIPGTDFYHCPFSILPNRKTLNFQWWQIFRQWHSHSVFAAILYSMFSMFR